MTARKQYQRLESPGLWRETPQAQRRDVLVSFGEASLILADPRTDNAVSHWSLPAVERLNPGQSPAVFGPGAEAGEELEIADEAMIGALEGVRRAVASRQKRRPWVRLSSLVLSVGALLALGVYWLPEALVAHTASVVPLAKRVEIGQRIISDLEQNGIQVCSSPLGRRAASRLQDRVLGPNPGNVVFLGSGLDRTAHLPGRHILVGRSLVEEHDSAEVLAGHLIAERLRADAGDPLLPLLEHAGFWPTLQLLTTGELPDSTIEGYGEAIFARPSAEIPVEEFLARMEAAGVPSAPYAFSVDAAGQNTVPLIERDPFHTIPPRPVLTDSEWVSLQGICG